MPIGIGARVAALIMVVNAMTTRARRFFIVDDVEVIESDTWKWLSYRCGPGWEWKDIMACLVSLGQSVQFYIQTLECLSQVRHIKWSVKFGELEGFKRFGNTDICIKKGSNMFPYYRQIKLGCHFLVIQGLFGIVGARRIQRIREHLISSRVELLLRKTDPGSGLHTKYQIKQLTAI